MRRWITLVALSAAHGWTAPHLHPAHLQGARRAAVDCVLAGLPDEEPPPFIPAVATGEDTPKTDGIPNYMLRTSGTVARIAEGPESDTAVQEDGVLYQSDRLVSIVTSDVIEMAQQQGGAAENVNHLGENILVEGMLFDDFMAEDTFEIASPDVDDAVVTLEIIGARETSELELVQLGDDEGARRSITSLLSIAPGFSGWSARVAGPGGRVRAGSKIAKRVTADA